MKKILIVLLAVSLALPCLCVGASAYSGRYVLDGLDSDYYTLLENTDEAMQLGSLSAKYESNGKPASISAGNDTGGASYGAYQFSSRYGVPMEFADWCISSNEGVTVGERLKAAYALDENTYGENFNAEWKLIAQESPEGFLLLQHNFTKSRYYDVHVRKLEAEIEGFEVDNYTIALKNVIWSRAVQHGANTDCITEAFKNLGGFNSQPEDVLIKAIYAQSSKLVDEPPYETSIAIEQSSAEKYKIDAETVTGKYLYYFSRNSSDIQVSVYKRLAINELGEALDMYVAAGGVLTPEEPVTPPTEPENPDDTPVVPENPDDTPTQPEEDDNDSPLIPVDPPQNDDGDNDELPDASVEDEPPVQEEPTNWFLMVLEAVMRFIEAIGKFFSNLFG